MWPDDLPHQGLAQSPCWNRLFRAGKVVFDLCELVMQMQVIFGVRYQGPNVSASSPPLSSHIPELRCKHGRPEQETGAKLDVMCNEWPTEPARDVTSEVLG